MLYRMNTPNGHVVTSESPDPLVDNVAGLTLKECGAGSTLPVFSVEKIESTSAKMIRLVHKTGAETAQFLPISESEEHVESGVTMGFHYRCPLTNQMRYHRKKASDATSAAEFVPPVAREFQFQV
jgi:hypothetical protein